MNYGIGNVKGSGGVSNTMLTTTTDATENSGTYTLDLTYLSETPKVNDYIVYVNSGNLTTLYQVSAVDTYNATLEKIGDIGGGKQLYQHNITILNTTIENVNIQITIINDSNIEIDSYDKLNSYLINNNFIYDMSEARTNYLLASGMITRSGKTILLVAIGVYSYNNAIMFLGAKTTDGITASNKLNSFDYIIDKVIPL